MTQKVDKITVWLHDSYTWSTDRHYTSDEHKSITGQQCDYQNIKFMSYMLFSLKILLECDLWIAKQSKIWQEHDFWHIILSQPPDLNLTSWMCRVRIWVECDWTEHLAWGGSWEIGHSDPWWYGTDLSSLTHQIIPVFINGTKFMKCEAHIYTKSF
jgi:hypothetical protein